MNFRERIRRLSVAAEVSLITGIVFALPIAASTLSALSGTTHIQFTNPMLLRLVCEELVLMSLAGFILRLRGWSVQDVNLQVSWKAGGIGFFLVLFTCGTYSFLISLIAASGIIIHFAKVTLQSNVSLLPAILASFVNATFEEGFVVGYLLKAVEHEGVVFAVGLSVLIRLLYHTYQGPIAILSVLPLGITFGLVYWRIKQLSPLILAHAALDLLAFMSR